MNGAGRTGTRHILVFRVGQLGDTLISLPAIAAIRRRHPDHRLVLLTENQPMGSGNVSAWDVLGPTGWFDDVMYYTPAQDIFQKIKTMAVLAQRIRMLQPELIYDLAPERTARQGRRDQFFFKWIAGIRNYSGGGFLAKPPKNTDGALPRIEPEWRRLLRVIGAESDAGGFRLEVPASEQQRARDILQGAGISEGERLLAVGPGSKMPAKLWPRERFRELGRRLLATDPALRLLVVGGKEDATLGAALCAEWGTRSHNLAGRLSIYGSAAVLLRCVAYVGNDAGAMHLAGMVGIPCAALFSARDYPGQWEPYGSAHIILRHETECAGCMRAVCPYDNKCLGLISVDEAERAVWNTLTAH